MKHKICLLGLLCLFFSLSAYPTDPVPGLKIGDKVPDILITQIINYPTRTAKISDFKDKVLILDFWATWCSVCVKSFPKTFALQQKFPATLQVLLVNGKNSRDRENDIQTFLDKRKRLYHFPCVVMDTALTALFPHGSVPHYIVIKNNIVLAATEEEEINETSIRAFINDKPISLRVKTDIRYDPKKPMTAEGKESTAPIIFSSLLTGHTEFKSSIGFKRESGGMVSGFHCINGPVVMMYMFAYPHLSYPTTRIIYDVPKPEDFSLDSTSNAWRIKHLYSYQSIYPPCSKADAQALLKEDLDRYFHLKLDSSYRDTDCYVLKLNSKISPKQIDTAVKFSTNIYEKSGGPVYYINANMDMLCYDLELDYKIPFINETGYHHNVSLDLPANYTTSGALISSLSKQGFILTREKRRISFLVVSENHPPK